MLGLVLDQAQEIGEISFVLGDFLFSGKDQMSPADEAQPRS